MVQSLWYVEKSHLVRIVQQTKLMVQLEECPISEIAVHELTSQPAPPLLAQVRGSLHGALQPAGTLHLRNDYWWAFGLAQVSYLRSAQALGASRQNLWQRRAGRQSI